MTFLEVLRSFLEPSLLLEMESPDGTSWHIAEYFHLAFLQGIGDSIVGFRVAQERLGC